MTIINVTFKDFIFGSIILQKNNDTASSLLAMNQITITKMAENNKRRSKLFSFLYPSSNGQYKHFNISCVRAINRTIFIILKNDLTVSKFSKNV